MTRRRPVERICLLSITSFLVLIALESGALAAGSPRLVLLDANRLIRIRERLQNRDPAFIPAFTKLNADAGRALDVKPLSVTEKNLSPPSDDKHDYMSIAPYWWPNPNSPDGLPYVRRDGEINPERDKVSDHARLDGVVQNVKVLALVYFFSRRESYAAGAGNFLRAWFLDEATRMNPN